MGTLFRVTALVPIVRSATAAAFGFGLTALLESQTMDLLLVGRLHVLSCSHTALFVDGLGVFHLALAKVIVIQHLLVCSCLQLRLLHLATSRIR